MMTGWFRRARQTRTPVLTQRAEAQSRAGGALSAYRLMGAVMAAAQLILWLTFYGYDRSVQTTWQAAVMLLLPLAGLWALWRAGSGAAYTPAGSKVALLLLPCLMVDVSLLLRVTAGYVQVLIPEYPLAVCVLTPAAFCWVTALLARENGTAYGTRALRLPLLALFLLSTVLVGASVNPARLYPLLGQGIGQTAFTALMGSGCVWGVALLFLLPSRRDARDALPALDGVRSAAWSLLPWLAGVVWALWLSLTRPWRSGDMMAIGERLMGMARHAVSIGVYELASWLWLFLLPMALIGCLTAGEKLLRRAIPGMPRSVAGLIVLAPGAAACLIWSVDLLSVLGIVLPWRVVLSLLAGTLLAIMNWGGSAA